MLDVIHILHTFFTTTLHSLHARYKYAHQSRGFHKDTNMEIPNRSRLPHALSPHPKLFQACKEALSSESQVSKVHFRVSSTCVHVLVHNSSFLLEPKLSYDFKALLFPPQVEALQPSSQSSSLLSLPPPFIFIQPSSVSSLSTSSSTFGRLPRDPPEWCPRFRLAPQAWLPGGPWTTVPSVFGEPLNTWHSFWTITWHFLPFCVSFAYLFGFLNPLITNIPVEYPIFSSSYPQNV